MKITAYDNLFELARTKIGGDSATINVEDSSGSNADLGSTNTAAAEQSFAIRAKGWKRLPIARSTTASIAVFNNSNTNTAVTVNTKPAK